MKNILHPSKSNIYGIEPRYSKTLLQQTYFAAPLLVHFIEVPQYQTKTQMAKAKISL